jgi:hypothetical protein
MHLPMCLGDPENSPCPLQSLGDFWACSHPTTQERVQPGSADPGWPGLGRRGWDPGLLPPLLACTPPPTPTHTPRPVVPGTGQTCTEKSVLQSSPGPQVPTCAPPTGAGTHAAVGSQEGVKVAALRPRLVGVLGGSSEQSLQNPTPPAPPPPPQPPRQHSHSFPAGTPASHTTRDCVGWEGRRPQQASESRLAQEAPGR